MAGNHYSKCMHMPDMRLARNHVVLYIILIVAGSKYMIMVCPDCHKKLSAGGAVEINYTGSRNNTRMIKRCQGCAESVFFEVRVL